MGDTPSRIPLAIARIAPDGNLSARQRRLLIEMALRRQKPGTGSSLEFLKQRTAMNPWPDFREILRGIPWVVVGGVATRAQDWADITRMLGLASEAQLDEVRAAVAQYSPEDRDDLESLIFIGKKEQESARTDEGGQ